MFKTVYATNSYFVANSLYKNTPADIRDLQAAYKKVVTGWLLGVGSEFTKSLLFLLSHDGHCLLKCGVKVFGSAAALSLRFCFVNLSFS